MQGVAQSESIKLGEFVIVGSGYENRRVVASELLRLGARVLAVGPDWPADIPQRHVMSRLETLRFLRRSDRVVLNVPHPQMRRTLNPFFFDLAAAGVPQLLLSQPRFVTEDLSSAVVLTRASEALDISSSELAARTHQLQRSVVVQHSLDARLNKMKEIHG